MGNQCVKSCSNSIKKRRPPHSELPSDIQNFTPTKLEYSLPKIIFEAEIYNIQLMNCPQGTYSLNFQISDVISITLPQKIMKKTSKSKQFKQSKQLRWKLHQNFAFDLTQYELRTHFLIIELFGQNKLKYSQLTINLYMIATGPQHHDFEVKLSSGKFSRLKFDFKISQIVQVSLKIDQIKIQFQQDMEGQQFDYSFKVIRNDDVTTFSQSSRPKKVKNLDEKNIYRQLTIDDQCQSPLKFRKSLSLNKMIKKDLKSFVEWSHQNQQKQKPLMHIATKLLSNDINQSFLYFLVWKIPLDQTKVGYDKQNFSLLGQSQINFNKIFQRSHQGKKLIVNTQTQSSSVNFEKISFEIQERKIVLEQPIWAEDGSLVGKSIISLSMTNPKFQKQMQACARTQDGVVNMTFFYKSYIGKNTPQQNVNIIRLIKNYQQIQNIITRLTELSNDAYHNHSQILQLQQQVYQQFEKISKIIRATLNQSFVMLSKSNQQRWKQQMDDQSLFIQLMNKLYYYIEDNTIFASICWEIVILIMKRGEFYLENIGFMNHFQDASSFNERKLQIAVKYQNVLYRYFLLALKSSQKNRNISNIIQAFKAFCYIRMPYFRQKIVQSIQKSYDQEIVELKLQHFEQITSDFSPTRNSKDRSIINLEWQKYFYDVIKGNSQNFQIQKQVQEQIDNSKWIKEISKRQQAFFQFTAQLVKRFNQLTQQIIFWKWNFFPGYTKIVRGFIVQMKKRKIMQYPVLMIKTSSELLANEQLINLLMPLIIQKTNAYNKAEIIKCLFILDEFFNSLTDKKAKLLPRKLNYLYLFKTFKLIIQSVQHTQAIIRTLILIYDYYQWMSPEWRDIVTMYLLGKVFFKLFFHWSYQVRIIFYNFLIIKIKFLRIQQISKISTNYESIQMNTKIAERYDQISTILLNAQNQKKKMNILDFRSVYEKDLYKKMRNKMRKKRQKQPTNKINQTNQIKQDLSHKQNQFKQKEILVLQNLLIPKSNLRKMSLPDQDLKNKSSTDFKIYTYDNNTDSPQQKLKIQRGNSFCVDNLSMPLARKLSLNQQPQPTSKLDQSRYQNNNQSSLQDFFDNSTNKLNKQNNIIRGRTAIIPFNIKSANTKLNYNIYNKQDHQLVEINKSEINYINRAIEEYRETLAEVNRYYQKRGEIPKRQLNLEPIISDKQS